ncbi:protein involved in chromosome partitioning [Bacillus atrophaeus UCMB-5137]|nr:protein involved in chromosome partitioning [Bacillus atrophaeus UCMB-5137]
MVLADKDFGLNDVVEMKKTHPCGANRWKIIRMGMDIRIKCEGCSHSVMIPRKEFERKLKKVLVKHEEPTS